MRRGLPMSLMVLVLMPVCAALAKHIEVGATRPQSYSGGDAIGRVSFTYIDAVVRRPPLALVGP